MAMLCAVSFSPHGQLHYFTPGPHPPRVGDMVLVPTEAGPEVAQCVWAGQEIGVDLPGVPALLGPAAPEDLARDVRAREARARARVVLDRLVGELALDMAVVAVDYLESPPQVTGYFRAPGRVDFRGLVRAAARELDAHVLLHQLSARDEARVLGGVGSCGRELCCATFLRDFEPVTLRMARDQDLPLNPMRISGACGRLMCCLKYEHPLYQEFIDHTPAHGTPVSTPQGEGTVVGRSVPGQTVVVRLAASGRTSVCPRASVCSSRRAFESAHPGPGPAGEGGASGGGGPVG